MPVVVGLPQEGVAVEGGPTLPPVVPRRQGWRALLYRHRALGLHRRATYGLRGGDRRHKAWPPSTAGARMSSVALLASLHRHAASGLRDGGRRRKASGLPPPPSHAWSPSTATPPLASLHCRATSGLRGGDHRRLGGGGL
jgi:hypothetical protein